MSNQGLRGHKMASRMVTCNPCWSGDGWVATAKQSGWFGQNAARGDNAAPSWLHARRRTALCKQAELCRRPAKDSECLSPAAVTCFPVDFLRLSGARTALSGPETGAAVQVLSEERDADGRRWSSRAQSRAMGEILESTPRVLASFFTK